MTPALPTSALAQTGAPAPGPADVPAKPPVASGPLRPRDAAGNAFDARARPGPDAIPPEVAAELQALKAEVEALQQQAAARELAELKAEAETAITAAPEGDVVLTNKTFRGGERSLQALNPEISIVGDAFARLVYQDGESYSPAGGHSGFHPRVVGIHFQANLDPFSFAKVVAGLSPAGIELGESYVTWSALLPGLSLTLGKFHQQFGVVNRWHAPGLDQFSYPLMLTEHFAGPLHQTGLGLLATLPALWSDQMDVELQITNGQNANLFAGEFFSVPSGLLHLRNYWDLDRNTYLELGLSGLAGFNNPQGKTVVRDAPGQLYDADGNPVTFYDESGHPVGLVSSAESSVVDDDDWRLTAVVGADLTLNWEPLNQAKYRGFTWRSEALYATKQVKSPAGRRDTIRSWGAYSYVEGKPAQNLYLGVRGDLTQVFALDNGTDATWAVVPYVTWWQSPWVRIRLEYDYIDWARSKAMAPEHRVLLQTTFSAGPHKHERY
ncbi:MAG: hypothetical protein JXP73_18430 [Deltaproteobacteria bacterium]|nr:hypothetical protein [Deltaproteobacteria bacterium]